MKTDIIALMQVSLQPFEDKVRISWLIIEM